MDNRDALLTLAIIEMILKYGPKAVLTIQGAWANDDPTPEDIRALFIVKKPEEYFKE
jgi:hypothetical protein